MAGREQFKIWILTSSAALLAAAVYLWLVPPLQKEGGEEKGGPGAGVVTGRQVKKTAIELTRLGPESMDALFVDEATLLDPTPLFLPTRWNSGQNPLPASLIRDLTGSFADYPAQVFHIETSLALSFPPNGQLPGDSVGLLGVLESRTPFIGMGRSEGAVPVLVAREAVVEVVEAGSGRRVWSETVREERFPVTNWQPMEFLLAVDVMGLVGPPVVVQRSGSERIDAFFKDYLARTLRVGERLSPGSYRVRVGP